MVQGLTLRGFRWGDNLTWLTISAAKKLIRMGKLFGFSEWSYSCAVYMLFWRSQWKGTGYEDVALGLLTDMYILDILQKRCIYNILNISHSLPLKKKKKVNLKNIILSIKIMSTDSYLECTYCECILNISNEGLYLHLKCNIFCTAKHFFLKSLNTFYS